MALDLDLDVGLGLRDFALDVALTVGAAETVALAGPSGAGKSTILRIVAGLRRPERGHVRLGDGVWTDVARGVRVAPETRRVGLVPQDHGLFTHLSVRRNVAYGGRERVDELLERLRIAHLADARPREISGGERQRVALARALARDPAVLLLDEPLSALDARLRAQVRDELEDLLAELALPTLLVSHDFRDAAALADRIAVIADGRVLQVGTATELTVAPAGGFVAAFTGASVLEGVAPGALDAPGTATVAVHPWNVRLADDGRYAATVLGVAPDGGRARVRTTLLVADVDAAAVQGLSRGDRIRLDVDPADVHVLPG